MKNDFGIGSRREVVALLEEFFAQLGKQGNGRGDKKGEYVANGGQVRLFGLYDKPAGVKPPPKPAKPPKK